MSLKPRFDRVVDALRREVARQLESKTTHFDPDGCVRAVLTELELQGIETPLVEKRKGATLEVKPGDIIQGGSSFHTPGMLLIVSGVRSWGGSARIIAYSPGPEGDAYFRLERRDFRPTGGVAPIRHDLSAQGTTQIERAEDDANGN